MLALLDHQLIVSILYSLLVSRQWTTAIGLLLMELVVFVFTRVFVGFQEGSANETGDLAGDESPR